MWKLEKETKHKSSNETSFCYIFSGLKTILTCHTTTEPGNSAELFLGLTFYLNLVLVY